MKKFVSLVKDGACNTLVLMLLFFIIAGMGGSQILPALTLSQALLLLLFGEAIAFSGLFFWIRGLPGMLSHLFRYASLLAVFLIVGFVFGKILVSPAKIFLAVFLFTVFYLLITGMQVLLRRLLGKEGEKEKGKDTNYTPIYK